MAEYRYIVADLLTDTVKEEIPFRDVSYGEVLNAPGSFSGKVPISVVDSRGYEKITRTNLDPARTALYVERDGVLVWGGILWTVAADPVEGSLVVGAEGFWSYFRRRVVSWWGSTFTATDQFTIAQTLISNALDADNPGAGGDIGVDVPATTCGVLRDRTYGFAEMKNVGEAVEQLAAVENGFDFSIDVSYSGSTRTKTLNLHYPRKGTRIAAVLDLGANVDVLSWSIDATRMANDYYVVGAGEGPLSSISRSTAARFGTYPLLQEVEAAKDVTDIGTLVDKAHAGVAQRQLPDEMFPNLSLRPTLDTAVGTVRTGDEVRIRANTGFLDFDSWYRVTAWTVAISEEGTETFSLAVTPTELAS